jgi:hypothetical protein
MQPMQPAGGFAIQANALLRKSLTYQKRNVCTNICLVSSPILFCAILFVLKLLVNGFVSDKDENNVRSFVCACVPARAC